MRTYLPPPVALSRETYTRLLILYPALTQHPNAEIYRRILHFVLFSTVVEEETRRLILPYTLVARLVGKPPGTPGFRAMDWIEAFDRDVLPLNCGDDYSYRTRHARTIQPEIDPSLLQALRLDLSHPKEDRVWFHNGQTVSRRNRLKTVTDYESELLAPARDVPLSYPAYPLVQYLLLQPQDCLERILKRNWPQVKAAVDAMPTSTERERRAQAFNVRLLTGLESSRKIYYTATQRSPRIFATGQSIHQLPRRFRHLALAGTVEMDLRAAQLAIVARLWNIADLQATLESGVSIWKVLLEAVGLPPAAKPIVKTTVYSIVFGMGRPKLRTHLASGEEGGDEGVGAEIAARFFRHPLIVSLLKARDRVVRETRRSGGAEDAFGRWIAVDEGEGPEAMAVPSVLAYVVQSYELLLMLSMLPILQSEPQIYVLSYLHDGMTLHFGNHEKRDRQILRLHQAVLQRATALGITTVLECKQIERDRESNQEHENVHTQKIECGTGKNKKN